MNNPNKSSSSNPWNKNQKKKLKLDYDKNSVLTNAVGSVLPPVSSNHKFLEAKEQLEASVQKHIKACDSSSDEELLEANVLIDRIINNYTSTARFDEKLKRIVAYLKDSLSAGAATCLICISKIKRDDQSWSCSSCYCLFHLMCIQRWSKDNICQKKQALEGLIVLNQVVISWCCPKCRKEYSPENIPDEYKCFCGKKVNPIYQSLLVPHSCGEICEKKLQPPCGHKCLLLCHPGSCPPCPVTVNARCYCGGKPPRLQRCSDRYWSCGERCGKLLECKKHYCDDPCHAEECKPCSKKSILKCMCKYQAKLRDCSSPVWQCNKVCGKILDCGNHKCMEICHAGDCKSCLLNAPRTCPCGKSRFCLPCTEETPTCFDTCDKLLECQIHRCLLKCHKNKCGMCLEIIQKQCRCGQHTKEIHCSKPFLCETKCKNMKDCNKHPCNKKCCDGNCSPCEKACGKTLNCGNHKCKSVCHRGPCYPCNSTDVVTCNCGQTKLLVPCGRKHRVKPPKCLFLCEVPPECHHESREPHRCHFGNCPPCKQICNRGRTSCSHPCSAFCHDAVMVKVEAVKATVPWEEMKPQKQKKCLPCPDCVIPVPVQCFGQHEISNRPCHLVKPTSCFRPCGRLLTCENHRCSIPCHTVIGSPNDVMAGSSCEVCERECTKGRPKGCQHQCPKPCHPGLCPPCTQMIRIKCHCSLLQLYVVCQEYLNPESQPVIQSCGNQCPKNFDCGHRCRADCHPGSCPDADLCKKKIKVFCKCKRLKKEFTCEVVRKNEAKVVCDQICAKIKEENEIRNRTSLEERRRLEKVNNEKEVEKYKKKLGNKKKNRDRRYQETSSEISFLRKYFISLSAVGLLVLSLVVFATFNLL